jgi:hypothetical protein
LEDGMRSGLPGRNARANVRMSPRSCRTTTSCFGPS